MAKNIKNMSNYELVMIAKAFANCENQMECITCPCCTVICDITDSTDGKDAFICEIGIRMAELIGVN